MTIMLRPVSGFGTFQKSMYCIYVYTMCGFISLSSKQVRLQQGDTNFYMIFKCRFVEVNLC